MKRNIVYGDLWRGVLVLALLLVGPAVAQPPSSRTGRDDGNGIGVARIALIAGDVSRQHGPQGDLVSADAGAPLVGGDSVFTKTGSRAEIRLDETNFLRLGPDTEVRLTQLGERYYQIELVRGTVGYSMLRHGEADASIHTPHADVTFVKDGVYRVTVENSKLTCVVVRRGAAEVSSANRSTTVRRGQSFRASEPEQGKRVAAAPKRDAFDEWVERRDRFAAEGREMRAGRPWRVYPTIGLGYGYPFYDPFWGFYGGYSRYYGGVHLRPAGGPHGPRR